MTAYRKAVWFVRGLRQYTVNGYLEAQKEFEPLDAYKDLSGRSYMVTGANSGIGKCVSLELAKRGATVHMVCRDETRGKTAQEEILTVSPNKHVHLHLLDMSKPHLVHQFAEKFVSSGEPLNCLVNNAGCMVNERIVDNGLEKNFATNTFGTYILTTRLVDVLEKADDARVITVSSGGMLLQKLDVNDIQLEHMSPFEGTMVYAQNKRQQVVMTEQWVKKYEKTGIHFSTMHPGWADTPAVRTSMPDFYERMKNKLRTAEQGADTLVWLCMSAEVPKQPGGSFYQDRKAVPKHLPLAWTKTSVAEDEAFMAKLNELYERYKVPDSP